MVNYEVSPALLQPYVPRGTTLDTWMGAPLLSIVAFSFRRTRLLGVPIPLHRNFQELNVRFYVQRVVGAETRRAVVFLQEVVPLPAVAWVARLMYDEPYRTLPMRSHISAGPPVTVEYGWRLDGRWQRCAATATGSGNVPDPGTLDAFITEHYWGYTRQRDGGTIEYRVEHPKWTVWSAANLVIDADLPGLAGAAIGSSLTAPRSAFIAGGSRVTVFRPARIPTDAGAGARSGAGAD